MSRGINARLRKLETKRRPGPPLPRIIWVDADGPEAKPEWIRNEGEASPLVVMWLGQDEPSPEGGFQKWRALMR